MRDLQDFIEELQIFLDEKKQEYSDELDEQVLPLQQDAENEDSEFHISAKKEYDLAFKNKYDIDKVIEQIQNLIDSK